MRKKKMIIIFIILMIICIVAMTILFDLKNEKQLVLPEEITTDEEYTNIKYTDESLLDNTDDIVGFLNINKIDLRAKVKIGSDKETLKNYIGVIGTNIYDGNVCLAAHNRGYEHSYFARLNELEVNDLIVYETNFFKKEYKVTDIKVIKDNDLSVLESSKNNKLTLITCIKNKKTQRLCVVAEENL